MAPSKGQALLQYCASDTSHYYDAQDAAELIAAFKEIGDKAVEASPPHQLTASKTFWIFADNSTAVTTTAVLSFLLKGQINKKIQTVGHEIARRQQNCPRHTSLLQLFHFDA